MELNHLKYFYEVARAGSFTKAARTLRISQSALSKTVALLEAREGVLLLHRSKSGVALTPIGAQIYGKCESLFKMATEIEGMVRGTQELCEGNLRFGASDHVGNYLLVPKVKSLQEKYPKLLVSILAGTRAEVVENIFKNELEFGLFFTRINMPGLVYEPVQTIDMAVVCRPSLLPASGSSAKIKDALEAMGYIGSISNSSNRHPSQGLFDLLGRTPRNSFETTSQEMQKRLCLKGCGFAFLARFMVEEELKQNKLVEIPVGKKLTETLYLAKRVSSALSFNAKTYLKAAGLMAP